MPRFLSTLLAPAVCLLALIYAAPALAADGFHKDELLFSQSSPRATLTPTKCKCDGLYILTLRRVGKHTVWFSDRPNRHAGHLPTANFTQAWSSFGFASDPPDAALSAIDASGHRRTGVVELTHPRYSAKHRTMRYLARTVPFSTGPLKVNRGADGFAPGRLRNVSLFIDDATAPVIDGCILHRSTVCAAGLNLKGVSLPGIDLTNANFTAVGRDTRQSVFEPYVFRYAGVNLAGANLSGAKLSGASLTFANLYRANLSGANVSSYADAGGFRYVANLSAAFAMQANLSGVNLTGALMPNINLSGANLTGANLTRVNLTFANLTGANLTGADITDADLDDAKFCNTIMPSGRLSPYDCPWG